MQLTSSDLTENERVPERFTCEGEDLSPNLQWTDVPEDATELALVCDDPDAPRGTFTHWVLWGLPPATRAVETGEVPDGARQGTNGFGSIGYRGPCPPPGHGLHHYHFTLYALGRSVDLEEGASVDELRAAIDGNVLAEATLIATYER